MANLPEASGVSRRHYKKDSRFILDLYTLTFDEHETVDALAMCTNVETEDTDEQTEADHSDTDAEGVMYYSLAHTKLPLWRSSSFGPSSLGSSRPPPTSSPSWRAPRGPSTQMRSLETNLHKILARKIAESEEVSFRKAKLLTKAYYRLLRSDSSVSKVVNNVKEAPSARQNQLPNRLSWHKLIRTDCVELRRFSVGLGNAVAALGDYLAELLQEKDSLKSEQDAMLDRISDITDEMLQ